MKSVFMQHKIAVGISLPKTIMEKIDRDRGDISRSRYLLRILEKRYLIERKSESPDSRIEALQSGESNRP
jgi:hypothetical protein